MRKILLLLACLMSAPGAADTIYKSVDRHGNVSYSSTPGKSAVEVEKVAPPSAPREEDVEAAHQRYRELEERDRQREQARREEAIRQQELERIKADQELRRQLNRPQKPANIIIVNQNPYYWGRRYDSWRPRKRRRKDRVKPAPMPNSKTRTAPVQMHINK